MRIFTLLVGSALAAAAFVAAPAASAQTPPSIKTAETAKGKTLVDAQGMTLYVFDKDVTGRSNCNGSCATNWPPVMAEGDAVVGDGWTAIKRDDGTKQWAYRGRPLYRWIKDTKAGDVTGDGVGNSWHVAHP